MRKTRPLIALLTDFSARDWYAATLKGLLLTRAPGVSLVDITHEIPPQDIVAGAFTLAAASPWFPVGTIFLAVVDPGVGGDRGLIAARADGRYYVGPDNGLLEMCLQRAKQRTVVRLTSRRYWLTKVSQTFHGRDVLAPVAAYLAQGGALQKLGPVASTLVSTPLPVLQRRGRIVEGRIIHIDAFGNLITNLPGSLLTGETAVRRAPLRYKGKSIRVVSSYGEGREGELIAVVDSLDLIELAVHERSAAWTLNAIRGEPVEWVAS